MAASKLSDVKRAWFQNKVTGATAQTPLTELQVKYWRQIGVTGNTFQELERNWLRKIVVDALGTPSGKYTANLLIQALSALTLPITKREQENWLTLFKFYTPA